MSGRDDERWTKNLFNEHAALYATGEDGISISASNKTKLMKSKYVHSVHQLTRISIPVSNH